MRVLIIDDDALYSWIIKKFIERENPEITVTRYHNAEKVLYKLIEKTIKADLIILDWEMPVMNGYTFVTAYAQMLLDYIPVVVLTNSIYNRDWKLANTLPIIRGYYVKPLNTEMIREILSYAEV